MNPANPLDTVVFISLPENVSLPDNAFPLDVTVPLPVQKASSDIEGEDISLDIENLSWEQILAGILTVLAYDQNNAHAEYYRNLLLTIKPNIKEELTEAAILKARNKDYDIAEEIFMALHGLAPEDMANILNVALFFDQRADSYRQSNLFEDADAYDESAYNYYKQVIDADPVIPEAFFNIGFFYVKQKNFSRGRECFETYLALTAELTDKQLGDSGKYKQERAKEIVADIDKCNLDDELFKTAYDLITTGQEEKGLESIRNFLEKNPKVWNAWFMLGWALRRLERWEDAKNAFEQCLSCGGLNTDTCNELSICLMELGDYKGAKNQLIEAMEMEPESTKIMSNMGYLALKQGDTQEAIRFFTAVLEFSPDDRIALEALKSLGATD